MKTALLLSVLTLGALSAPAFADDHHRNGHGRNWGHHENYHRPHHRSFVSFSYWNPPVYRPIYRPVQVVNYVPAPVIMNQPAPLQFSENNGYCREYQSTVRVGSQIRNSYGTACLQPDGSWSLIN